MAWMILDRLGQPMHPDTLPERPVDTRASDGDPFAPWYNPNPHLHVTDGTICGMHYEGSLEEARQILELCIAYEQKLFETFGFDADMDLANVMPVLERCEQVAVLEQLRAIQNPDESWIHANEPFTVSELVKDITHLTSRGREHLALWKRAQARLRVIRAGKRL